MKRLNVALLLLGLGGMTAMAQNTIEKDAIKTGEGDVEFTFIGHGTLMMGWNGKIIHVDPYGTLGDYTKLPKADLILITHEHPDHLDPAAVASIRSTNTIVVATKACASKVRGAVVMTNGDVQTVMGIKIEAVPAYNIVNKRDGGRPYHPRGDGNGYVLTVGGKRLYIAGDTENTPEMKALKDIDVAFLPMNLPYTMTPAMVADAARAFRPKILYPYHYGETDPAKLVELLKDTPEIDVRVRRMK